MEIQHRVPQQFYKKGNPHRVSNLYGLPKNIHQNIANREWLEFTKLYTNPSHAQIVKKDLEIKELLIQYINRIGK